MDTTYNLNGAFKPTMKRFADLDGPDFFPTPAWATYALIDNEKFVGDIWESACGNGAMSAVLGKAEMPAPEGLATKVPLRKSDFFCSAWDRLPQPKARPSR